MHRHTHTLALAARDKDEETGQKESAGFGGGGTAAGRWGRAAPYKEAENPESAGYSRASAGGMGWRGRGSCTQTRCLPPHEGLHEVKAPGGI